MKETNINQLNHIPSKPPRRLGRFAHAGLIPLVWLAMSVGASGSVRSDINRCFGEDNVPIFTDRTCSALNASERETETKPEVPVATALPTPGHDCSRQVDALQSLIRVALESGDVNQLASLYHWIDVSAETADTLIPGFQAISSRRLLAMEVELSNFDGMDHPVKLWLSQYDPERPGQTIRTGFNLVRNSGCWWLHGQH